MLNWIPPPAKKWMRGPYRNVRRRYARWRHGFGPTELLGSLRALGIHVGDVVFVHSGTAGFEGFCGTATDIVRALQDAVGPVGTLLMPTLSMTGSALDYATSGRIFDSRMTPSQVGLLSEVFRRSPGVVRSIHPTHSVAVWGAEKDWWVEKHYLADTPCGRGTPYSRLCERDGKIVFAGLSIACMTYFHYAEEVLEHQMPFSPFTEERYVMRCRVGGQIIETAPMRLYNREVSRRRRLLPLAQELQHKQCWTESRTGTLNTIVLNAREIVETLSDMAARGIFCYEAQ